MQRSDMLSTIALGVVLFVATDLDDLFLLVVLFAGGRVPARTIVAGQFLGIAALVVASALAALLALAIPPRYLGLLGLVPIALGIRLLRRGGDDDDDEPQATRVTGTLAVAAITIANGGDNIGVYTPVFATRAPFEIAMLGLVFAAMTATWIALARWLVAHPTLGAPIRRHARPLLPWVLIALGLYVLVDAGTLGMP